MLDELAKMTKAVAGNDFVKAVSFIDPTGLSYIGTEVAEEAADDYLSQNEGYAKPGPSTYRGKHRRRG